MTETNGPIHEPFDFTDLEDPTEWGWTPAAARPLEDVVPADPLQSESQATVGRYPCRGCGGSGEIAVYRRGGGWGQTPTMRRCWKGCGGSGYTKTSPETLAKRREQARAKREAKRRAAKDAAEAFLADREDVAAWFERQLGRAEPREFATSCWDALHKYGALSDGRLAAIERDVAKYEAIVAERRAAAPADGLDLSELPDGYYAVPDGDTRLKVRVNRPKKNSRWHGYTFVSDGAEYGQRQNYGRQRPGGTYEGKITEQLRAIAADPEAASIAYGKLTGSCGVCGRALEDEQSVERGIGPICAAKTGWGA